MNDILDDFKKSNQKVYKYFLEKSSDFLKDIGSKGLIKKTPINEKRYGKSVSDNSFSFEKLDGDELETLVEIFGPINKKHFVEATKGNELKRILTLHSSALLSLLFFNSVSDEHPLEIKIGNKQYKFTIVEFEFENTCLKGQNENGKEYNPSCIDVKLADKGQNAILFLESKLSEYLHNGKQTGISKEYENQYGDNIFNKAKLPEGLSFIEDEVDGTLTLTTTDGKCSHYCQGLKQMMCHFIGAMNYKQAHPKEEVLLGTILLNLSSVDKAFNSYNTYYNDYKQLAEKLNKLNNGVAMIEEPLTYQELYKEAKSEDFELSPKVVEFYGFEE